MIPATMRLHGYGPDQYEAVSQPTKADIERIRTHYPQLWLECTGRPEDDLLIYLESTFKLHRLALEDCFTGHHRARAEEYSEHAFVLCRMPEKLNGERTLDQLSIFLNQQSLITFQLIPQDCLEGIRSRLQNREPKLLGRGPDFLAYLIIDTLIQSYFPVIESIGDDLEEIEDIILERPSPKSMQHVHATRRDLLRLRRNAWPHREAVLFLTREDGQFVQPETRIYFRDTYTHVVQVIDLIETYREICSDLSDLYMSLVSNRTNEIMRVLTVTSTVFIPLSFVASVYGMNFDTSASPWNMPELKWPLGYPFAIVVMLAVASGLLIAFARRGWLKPIK